MKFKNIIYTLTFLSIMSGCNSADDVFQPIENTLVADAGTAQTVSAFTEVTLDGSASTGPEGFSYEWIYNGGESINLSSTSEAIVTFTPEKNNTYDFMLRITSGGQFNTSSVQVTVSGALVLDASSFTADILNLKDIDGNFGGPDYLINADFTIPTGKTLSVENGQDVTISVSDGAGIIINGSFDINSTTLLQASATDWKGILVDGGTLNGNSGLLTIDKAGSAAFAGHEAAAITFTNSGRLSLSTSMTITNTISSLGMVLTPTTSSSWDMSSGFATIDALVPVKAPIGYLPNITSKVQPSGDYDYFHFTTSGAGVTEGSVTGTFSFNTYKYFIDGDFTAGSPFSANSSTIFMKAGAGIVCSEAINLSSTTIEGLDGANWKGVAGSQLIAISSSTVMNAGSDVHNTGSFSTTEKAAIHANGAVNIQNSSITNSQGYGVYLNGFELNNTIENTVFTGTMNEDVNLPYGMVGSSIKTGNTWSTDTPVALRATSNNGGSAWPNLGNGKAYLATQNLVVTSGQLALNPGVKIKFQSGTSLTVNTGIIAQGTVTDPIVFEGQNNASGSWNGIHLLGTYKMAYCTINNGGETALSGGEKTNVLFYSNSSFATYPQTNYSFENNTVTNSAGYGVQVFLGKYDPVTPTATNTYTNNTSGDIKLP